MKTICQIDDEGKEREELKYRKRKTHEMSKVASQALKLLLKMEEENKDGWRRHDGEDGEER